MPKTLPIPTPRSRYSREAAVAEVVAELADRAGDEPQKAVAQAIGLDEAQFSHRLADRKSHFSIEQLGAMADYWRMPPGWPFVPISISERARLRRERDCGLHAEAQLRAAESAAPYRAKSAKKPHAK